MCIKEKPVLAGIASSQCSKKKKKSQVSVIVSSRWWLIYELRVLPEAIFFILTLVAFVIWFLNRPFFPICHSFQ